MNKKTKELLKSIHKILDDKKAIDITVLKLPSKTSITDYFIIASGTSEPHLRAIRLALDSELHKLKIKDLKVDYEPKSAWAIVDGFDFMVHLFLSDQRGNYSLEKLWNDAERIDISKL